MTEFEKIKKFLNGATLPATEYVAPVSAVVPVVNAMVVAPKIAAAACTATAATATESNVLGFIVAPVGLILLK